MTEKGDARRRIVKGLLVGVVSVALLAVVLFVAAGLFVGWDETFRFVDWLSGATAFGTAFAGLAALVAASLAYLGVRETVSAANERDAKNRESSDKRDADNRASMYKIESENREFVDAREREAARHARYTTIVGQLASDQPMVRTGGLWALSALADEWEREARAQCESSDDGQRWLDVGDQWKSAMEALPKASFRSRNEARDQLMNVRNSYQLTR